MTNYHIL